MHSTDGLKGLGSCMQAFSLEIPFLCIPFHPRVHHDFPMRKHMNNSNVGGLNPTHRQVPALKNILLNLHHFYSWNPYGQFIDSLFSSTSTRYVWHNSRSLGQAVTRQQPGAKPAAGHVDRVAQHRQVRHEALVDVKAAGRGGRRGGEAQPEGLVQDALVWRHGKATRDTMGIWWEYDENI